MDFVIVELLDDDERLTLIVNMKDLFAYIQKNIKTKKFIVYKLECALDFS